MPAHCSLCRDGDEAPARQWLRHNSELLAASDQVISSPVDLHVDPRGYASKCPFGSFSTIRTRAELVWYKPTIRSEERTQTLRRRAKQRSSRALDDPPPLLRERA